MGTGSLSASIYAVQRPLIELQLSATKPATASALLGLAQPLGATALKLTVKTFGALKDGGKAHFAVSDVKPTHQMKPLDGDWGARDGHRPAGSALERPRCRSACQPESQRRRSRALAFTIGG